jgi:competence protein ComEC
MVKSKIFFFLSTGFIGGVAAASFYYPQKIGNLHLLMGLTVALIVFFTFYENKKSVVFSFTLMFFALGVYLVTSKLEETCDLNLDGQNFFGEVMIMQDPESVGKYQKIIISPDENRDVKFLLNVYDYAPYFYGDKLRVECVLKKPENFSAGFDYQMYLAKDGVGYECQKSKIEKLEGSGGNFIYRIIFRIKNIFNEKIAKLIPAPEAGLLSGLLLGGNNLLGESWQEKFSITGMTHIVAVSGYNVTIIAEYLMLLGIWLGLWRRQAFWFAVSGITLFIFMIGLPSSAVRAGVMGILLIWAMKNGRLANSQNALLFSASVMLLINPLLLRWDVGFQLSFLATAGIIYFYPLSENYLIKNNKVFGWLEILLLTLSAQIFVLPIILFNFQKLSLVSPLANLLILPIIPLAMILGFTAVLAGFIFMPLAIVLAWLAYLPLKYETLVINYLASLQYASVKFNLSWPEVVIWYVILLVFLFYVRMKKNKIV